MPEQKALFLESSGGEYVVRTKAIPKAGPGQVVVKSLAIALNPIDWKVRVYNPPFIKGYPVILGFDSAGVVEEIGEGVTSLKKGERVLHQGGFHGDTASFQEFVLVPAELVAKIPDNITLEQASSIPLCIATAAEGLYGNANRAAEGVKQLTPPWDAGGKGVYKGKSTVVFGGSSSVGQYAIQLLELSGFSNIITTASPHNKELVKTLGATHIIDRNSDVVAEVKRILGGESIDFVVDIISSKETQQQALAIVATGGQVVTISGVVVDKAEYPDKHLIEVYADVYHDNVRPLAVSLYKKLTELLASGDIKPNEVEVLPNGLAGITAGLKRMEAGTVSAVKLVVRPTETP